MATTAAMAAGGFLAAAAPVHWTGRVRTPRADGTRRRARILPLDGGAIVLRDDFLRHFSVVSVNGRRLSVKELETI